MSDTPYTVSSSGVRIATDFRDNLIVDRYDPVLASMRAGKREHMRSENSEDVITWNVFRSLRQLDPGSWLKRLSGVGLPDAEVSLRDPVAVHLWRTVSPPPSLVALGDEGDSEIDVAIETPEWVWFIEAKYQSDISTQTTTRPERDQVIRNVDVGTYYAGVRDFFFTLLIHSEYRSKNGVRTVAQYADLNCARDRLADHRPDGLLNLKAVTLMTWRDLAKVLQHAGGAVRRCDERVYADRALSWMRGKSLLDDAC